MKPILSLALLVLLLGAVAPSTYARTWQVKSPDGRTTVSIESTAEGTSYSVSRDGIRLLQPSRLSLTLADGRQLGSGLVLGQVATMRDKRTTPIYQRAGIDEQYRLIRLTGKGCAIEWRVYNGGVAYRFVTSASDSLTVRNELTELKAAREEKIKVPQTSGGNPYQNQAPQKGAGSAAPLPPVIFILECSGNRFYLIHRSSQIRLEFLCRILCHDIDENPSLCLFHNACFLHVIASSNSLSKCLIARENSNAAIRLTGQCLCECHKSVAIQGNITDDDLLSE